MTDYAKYYGVQYPTIEDVDAAVHALVEDLKIGVDDVDDLRTLVIEITGVTDHRYPMVICSYCQEILRMGCSPISHGICMDCYERVLAGDNVEAIKLAKVRRLSPSMVRGGTV